MAVVLGSGTVQAADTAHKFAAGELSRGEIDQRLKSWTDINGDPSAQFSASAAIADLTAILDAAARSGYSEAARDAAFLMGQIEAKRLNNASAVAALNKALSLSETLPPKREQLVSAHFTLAKIAEADGDFAKAAAQFRQAIGKAAVAPTYSEDNRLGMAQELGFVLHEDGQFEEALRVNRETLAGGERLHGADDPRLKTVHINIAQNLHALERREEIEPHLKAALAMSRASGQVDYEQDMLFQLGVLAFETGRHDDARRWMKERIALLRAEKRDDLIGTALEDFDELENRIRKTAAK